MVNEVVPLTRSPNPPLFALATGPAIQPVQRAQVHWTYGTSSLTQCLSLSLSPLPFSRPWKGQLRFTQLPFTYSRSRCSRYFLVDWPLQPFKTIFLRARSQDRSIPYKNFLYLLVTAKLLRHNIEIERWLHQSCADFHTRLLEGTTRFDLSVICILYWFIIVIYFYLFLPFYPC